MTDDRLHLPTGAVIAAVILGLMAFVGLLLAAFSLIAQFFIRSPLIPHIPIVRIVAAGFDAVVLALVVLAVLTIVGLFRLRIWARYSMVLLGLLDFLVFGLMTAGVLIARVKSGMASMPMPNNPHLTLGDVLLALAAIYGVLAFIGLWWMIYFNAKSVRQVFADSEARLTS
ncbi:MAG TPA: hypothetical protein VME86_13685 [Acidobacteriaceae bacterium]|nr:hypothetical protein [Acidobacteriaceae bacterium]